ncbi:MAG: NirA family protein [Beijerinckiaceae bacterium]|nr:MAG: NirA family protein [Beijerinckiaceae bacterium]
MNGDFTPEQKRYLEGLASGLQIARAGRGAAASKPSGAAAPPASSMNPAGGPDAIHLAAMARTEAAGKKLSDPEKWKREEHPFDAYARLEDQALRNEFPKPSDNFRWRYFGLFYVAPAQNAYMCRLRIPNGILSHWQFSGLADVADRYGGGYAHATTRANLQIREIAAEHATHVVEAIQDLGLCSRGSGADNIRNVTGDATAGIDRQALLDTRSFARSWHFHVLNDRSLSGLPRKFNVAFDGGGAIPTLEDTNDIGFQAVEVRAGASIPPGCCFRLILGGITGHKDFASDTGVMIRPDESTKVADAIVRVFIENGDRTDRNKARLKYLLDSWGFEKFLAAVESKLGYGLTRIDKSFIAPRPAQHRQAHVGAHRQKQEGFFYLGVVLPVGKLTTAQMRELAAIAHECGDGDIRLTVWQNLLISGISDERLREAQERIEACGLDWKASSIRAGLVACTGSRGCKFAAADTKGDAEQIAAWCASRVRLDQPINIHLTGCHHSCAQHYIGDIGLIGARVSINDDGDTVDGYHVFVGGGFGLDAAIGRELYRDVKAENAPLLIERMLKAYLAHRADTSENFHQFTERHPIPGLRQLIDAVESNVQNAEEIRA